MWLLFFCLDGCCFSSYLHQNKIIHGNVSLATIFIQHNGLVKIGSGVSPIALSVIATNQQVTNYVQYSTWKSTYLYMKVVHMIL